MSCYARGNECSLVILYLLVRITRCGYRALSRSFSEADCEGLSWVTGKAEATADAGSVCDGNGDGDGAGESRPGVENPSLTCTGRNGGVLGPVSASTWTRREHVVYERNVVI